MLHIMLAIVVLQIVLVIVQHIGAVITLGSSSARPRGIRLPHVEDKDRRQVYFIRTPPQAADDQAMDGDGDSGPPFTSSGSGG